MEEKGWFVLKERRFIRMLKIEVEIYIFRSSLVWSLNPLPLLLIAASFLQQKHAEGPKVETVTDTAPQSGHRALGGALVMWSLSFLRRGYLQTLEPGGGGPHSCTCREASAGIWGEHSGSLSVSFSSTSVL